MAATPAASASSAAGRSTASVTEGTPRGRVGTSEARSGGGIVHRARPADACVRVDMSRARGLGPAVALDARRYARAVKLVVAIVHHEDAGGLVEALLDRDYRATRLASSGGFLKQSNATVILGVEDDHVDAVVEVIRETCNARTQVVNPMPPIMEPGEFFMPYPLEVEVGGATVFVLPVDRFQRLWGPRPRAGGLAVPGAGV